MTTKSPNSRIGTPVDRAPKAPTNTRSGPASQQARSWVATAAIIAIILAVVTAALITTHTPAQAQSAVLISNTGQTAHSSGQPLTQTGAKRAQAFTLSASASTAGYTVDSIGIAFHTIGDTSTVDDDLTVTLNANSSSGSPGDVLCTLSNPSTFSASGVHTFDAPTTGTACPLLTQNKTYFAVIERANNNTDTISLNTTASTDEDSGGATGWSISNIRKWYTTAWATTSGESHQIEINGILGHHATGVPTISGTPRVDETLTADTSGIEDADGLTNQNFSYKWFRFDGTDETVITGAASSTYTLTNADADRRIKVKVAFDDDLGNPEGPLSSILTTSIVPSDILVKNTGIVSGNTGLVLNTTFPKAAQSFTTGTSTSGYTLSSIGFKFVSIADTSAAGADLKMTLNEDSSGEPGTVLCTLTDPASFAASGVNTFDAPTTCPTLAKETTYHVVLERVTGTTSIARDATTNNSEDTGSAPGWSIGNFGHTISGTTWGAASYAHQIRIRGSVFVEPTILVKNTGIVSGNTGLVLNTTFPKAAQSFTTGTSTSGYTLSSIGFKFVSIADTSAAGADLKMTLNEDSSGEPGTVLCTLTDPASFFASGVNTFHAPTTCPTLAKETTYHVVLERVTGTTSIARDATTNNSEDTGSAPGWSIGNFGHTISGTTWGAASYAHQIDVNGLIINHDATGAPTISGTPRAGEVLTADTSSIEDDDGLSNVSYVYQWLHVDGMDEADISRRHEIDLQAHH